MQPVFKRHGTAFLLLLPTLFILTFFLYLPTIQTFIMSFYQVGFLGLSKLYVGLENYQIIFTEPEYRDIMANTLTFVLGSVTLSMGLGLAFAVLANEKITGARYYRLLLIWPYALPPAVAGVIFLFLFSAQVGIINYFLGQLFGITPDWLADPELAMTVVILASVWKNVGYNVVFYLAALQNLPGDVLEAATIDGATGWQRFWRITFPLLSPMTFFLLIMNTIAAFFDVFAFIDLITKGGPNSSTTVFIYAIYRDGFEYFKSGLASAQSVFLFLLVVVLTVLKFRLQKKVHYAN
ncbi:sugar ABC transporter permease [Desulfovibrio mangrovi]|uniref:carbohydrate ABC transporter permease n=1 Tax=Desulfovibrio mangrovi TaxID=2976983 RepID=UPI002245F275|nr:sugar ABC transporter permease [Desulfovibrio mangrovi]UZP65977.1 sugar ABC transporter permease [Desulfovibrio mangrovi]